MCEDFWGKKFWSVWSCMEKCWSWDFTVGGGDHLDPPKLLSKSTWLIGKIDFFFFLDTKTIKKILRAEDCPQDPLCPED